MTPSLGAGLALALASAGALNWGFFVQHGAASALPRLSLRRPLHSLATLFAHRRWLVGFLVGLAGWALYVAALALAPLSLVQATSAGGIGLLALLVSRAGGVTLARHERAGVAAAAAGLALLALSLGHGGATGSHGAPLVVAAWIAASLLLAVIAAGPAARVLAAGAGFGVAAGVLYAAGDVATKSAVSGGARLAFVAAVLGCHGLAFVALQLGFQRGDALATAGLSTLLTNALPIAAGMTVFHERLPVEPLGALRVVAFCVLVLGAAALASPAEGRDLQAISMPLDAAASSD